MLNVLGVVYCLSVVLGVVAFVVLAVVDVVEHFQNKKKIKIIERLLEEFKK